MARMSKITTASDFQRYFTSFCHAIGFTFAIVGIFVPKNSQINENQRPFTFLNLSCIDN